MSACSIESMTANVSWCSSWRRTTNGGGSASGAIAPLALPERLLWSGYRPGAPTVTFLTGFNFKFDGQPRGEIGRITSKPHGVTVGAGSGSHDTFRVHA